MTARWAKGLGALILSAMILHAGVAWTLENCLNDNDVHRKESVSYEGSLTSRALANPHNTTAVIHCSTLHYAIDLRAEPSTVFRLTRLVQGGLLKAAFLGGLISSSQNGASLGASFEWFLSLAPPVGSLLHLSLSVLRI